MRIAKNGNHPVVAKIDCEGCEYMLLTQPCNILREVEEYLVEVHGAQLPLIDYMENCGYKPRLVKIIDEHPPQVTLWLLST